MRKLRIAFWKLNLTSVLHTESNYCCHYYNKYKVLDKALIEFPVTALSNAVSYSTTPANVVHRVVQHYAAIM
jgi:hypothetical protein